MRKSDTFNLTSKTSKWFHYYQNNSGGSFDIDDNIGLGPHVFIEAYDADHANSRAMELGIYFDGVHDEIDCDCCGDRWNPAYDGDGYDTVKILKDYYFSWHDTVYIHQLDSTDGNRLKRVYKEDFA